MNIEALDGRDIRVKDLKWKIKQLRKLLTLNGLEDI